MATKLPQNVVRLIEIYSRAQSHLIRIISQTTPIGSTAFYQKGLLDQISKELDLLNIYAKGWAKEELPIEYEQGIRNTNEFFRSNGIPVLNVETKAFSKLHKQAIELLVYNTTSDLIDANRFVGRQMRDVIRQAGLEATAKKIAMGETVKQAKKNITEKLITQGINGIKTKNGRMISLDAYAATVARSTTREATNTAMMNQMTEMDYDLVQITSINSTCSICAIYEGRIYSISGNDKRFPKLDMAYSGQHMNIHPNCRHQIIPFVESLANNLQKDIERSNRPFVIDEQEQAKIDRYNTQQKKVRELRQDRDQWERYKLAMPSDAPKTLSAFRRMKGADSDRWQELQAQYRSRNAQ